MEGSVMVSPNQLYQHLHRFYMEMLYPIHLEMDVICLHFLQQVLHCLTPHHCNH
jgi:hypothetical protein